MFATIFDVNINISFSEVVTGVILYGVVHGIYKVMNYCLKQLETETGRIIKAHVQRDHKQSYKHCFDDTCATKPQMSQ